MNIGKIFSLVIVFLLLFGCSKNEGSYTKGYQARSIKISGEISHISVSGNGISMFFLDQNHSITNRVIQLEDSSEIHAFITLIQHARYYTGPMTEEGPNLKFVLYYQDGTHDLFDLWIRPDELTGRFSTENGELYIFEKEDVQTLIDLMAKNAVTK